MSECIRCGKTFFDVDDAIHTCTPTNVYRAGMKEGAKKASSKLKRCLRFIEMLADLYDEENPVDLHRSWAKQAHRLLAELKA